MNTWIAKFGGSHFENNSIDVIKKWVTNNNNSEKNEITEFRGDHIHYISICSDPEKWNKTYHNITESLFGYSGFIASTTQPDTDFRSAKNIQEKLISLSDIYNVATGHFSLFKADYNSFECVVDALPAYKVFYCQDLSGDTYVSNNSTLISLLTKPNTNTLFYVNYITADGTYGNETEFEGIYTLPAFGRLKWDVVNGLKIDSYKRIDDLIRDDISFHQLLDEMANEYENIAKYIVKYHKAAISQSGGYDSRIAINMFNGLKKNKILCYTFPDHPNDRKLAKKVVADHKFTLKYIETSDVPYIETLHNFLEEEQAPFINYNNIFGYVTHDGISSIYENPENVQLIGLGGEAYQNFTKFDCTDQLNGYNSQDKTFLLELPDNWNIKVPNGTEDHILLKISKLSDLLIDREFLTEPGYQFIREGIFDYYYHTYKDIISNSDYADYQIANVHFLFERVGNYQAFKHYYYARKHDYFLPFGTKRMLETILSSPQEHLYRGKKGSIHHELSKRLTNGKSKRIHFTRGIHWDASKVEKYKYHRIDPKIEKLKRKFISPEKKFTTLVRKNFFQSNLNYYRDVIHQQNQSDLWNYFDYNKIKSLFEMNTDLYKNHSNLICKLVPLLKKGI